MKTIKTVLAGLGRIGWQFHLPNIAANAGFDLTAVCDALPERLEEARAKYGVKGYTDYQTMLDQEQPELVVIATPTHLHAEHAIYAMEHGCDVFLDKPMAPDLAQADRILETRERTGRKLMMYQPKRAEGTSQVLRQIMQSGIIGEVYMIKMHQSAYVYRDDWQAFKKYGGGMLNNYGAHSIDACLYLADSTAKRVDGHLARIASVGDADDVVKVIIETENGVWIDIDINMAAALELPLVVVYGRHGTAMLMTNEEGYFYHVRYFDPGSQMQYVASDALAAAGRLYSPNRPTAWQEKNFPVAPKDTLVFYDKCYAYFGLEEEPFVPVAQTREVMRVMAECRKSAMWEA